jgi:tetratricopeptide (TPR) repeat protein
MNINKTARFVALAFFATCGPVLAPLVLAQYTETPPPPTQLPTEDSAAEATAYPDFGRHTGLDEDPAIQEKNARRQVDQSVKIGPHGRSGEALSRTLVLAREREIRALFGKGTALVRKGALQEAIAAFNEIDRRFSGDFNPMIRQRIAMAQAYKGAALGLQNRHEEAIVVYNELDRRFSRDSEASVREWGVGALASKADQLNQLGRHAEAITVYDNIVHRFGEDTHPVIRERVAAALLNKGMRLGQQGKTTEEISIYDEINQRFSQDERPAIRETVTLARLNRTRRGAPEAPPGTLDQAQAQPQPAAPEPATKNLTLSGWIGLYGLAGNELFDDEKRTGGARLHLETKWDATDTLRAQLALEAPSDRNFGDNRSGSVVREAWLRYSHPSFDLTIGQQYLPEGRSDWIRPQEQFAPRDLTQISVLNAEQRLGLPAVRLDWFASSRWTFTTAYVRQVQGDVLPNQKDSVLPTLPELTPLRHRPRNGGLARLEWRHGIWEAGLAYSNGRSVRPLLNFSLMQGLTAESYKQERISFDGSINMSGKILRWDMSLINNDVDERSGLAPREYMFSLGWDTNIFTDTMFNFQFIGHKSNFYSEDLSPLFGQIQRANRQLSSQYESWQSWITVNMNYQMSQRHELEGGYLAGLQHRGAIGFLRWSWSFADQWRLSLRAQAASGKENTLPGSMHPSRMGFAELRYQY